MIMRRVVVFPAPFGPSRPRITPRVAENETPLTASTSPKRLLTPSTSRTLSPERFIACLQKP